MITFPGVSNADGGVYGWGVSSSVSERIAINCNVQKYTGNWYIGVQRLYTNSFNYNYCNVDSILLDGATYSYTNRGV